MTKAGKAMIAIDTAVFATVAGGSILAVLANNVPLGAGAGVAAGVATLWLIWPRRAKTDA